MESYVGLVQVNIQFFINKLNNKIEYIIKKALAWRTLIKVVYQQHIYKLPESSAWIS